MKTLTKTRRESLTHTAKLVDEYPQPFPMGEPPGGWPSCDVYYIWHRTGPETVSGLSSIHAACMIQWGIKARGPGARKKSQRKKRWRGKQNKKSPPFSSRSVFPAVIVLLGSIHFIFVNDMLKPAKANLVYRLSSMLKYLLSELLCNASRLTFDCFQLT